MGEWLFTRRVLKVEICEEHEKVSNRLYEGGCTYECQGCTSS